MEGGQNGVSGEGGFGRGSGERGSRSIWDWEGTTRYDLIAYINDYVLTLSLFFNSTNTIKK